MVNCWPVSAVVSTPAAPSTRDALATITVAPVVTITEVGGVVTGAAVTTGAKVLSATAGVVTGGGVMAAPSSSLRIWRRMRKPATTATIAMMIAAVEPMGEPAEPVVSRDRRGCSLLMPSGLLVRRCDHPSRRGVHGDDALVGGADAAPRADRPTTPRDDRATG